MNILDSGFPIPGPGPPSVRELGPTDRARDPETQPAIGRGSLIAIHALSRFSCSGGYALLCSFVAFLRCGGVHTFTGRGRDREGRGMVNRSRPPSDSKTSRSFASFSIARGIVFCAEFGVYSRAQGLDSVRRSSRTELGTGRSIALWLRLRENLRSTEQVHSSGQTKEQGEQD